MTRCARWLLPDKQARKAGDRGNHCKSELATSCPESQGVPFCESCLPAALEENKSFREQKRGLWYHCCQLPQAKQPTFDLQWFEIFVGNNTFIFQKAFDHRFVASNLWAGQDKAYYQAAPALLEAFEAAIRQGLPRICPDRTDAPSEDASTSQPGSPKREPNGLTTLALATSLTGCAPHSTATELPPPAKRMRLNRAGFCKVLQQVDEKLAELTAEADLKAHQASWSEFKDTEAAIWSDRLLQLVQRAREERDSVARLQQIKNAMPVLEHHLTIVLQLLDEEGMKLDLSSMHAQPTA